jgi:hypothetical protein
MAIPDVKLPVVEIVDDARAAHRRRHVELHQALDELAADYIRHQPIGGGLTKRLGNTTVLELLEWSHAQTENPTEPP